MITFNNTRHQLLYEKLTDVCIHKVTAKYLHYYKYIIIMVNTDAQVCLF